MKTLRTCVAFLLLLNTGCLKTVTFNTVIRNDGAVDRHIQIACEGVGLEDDLKLPDKKGWQVYKKTDGTFEAKGRFASVADIPLDFEKTDDAAKKAGITETSKSIKRYGTTDYALFTVHDYTETITDITSRKKFDEGVEFFIGLRQFGYIALDRTCGDEVDFTKLKAYIDKEIVPRFCRLAAGYWEARVNKDPGLEKRLARVGIKLLRELGVELPENVEEAEKKSQEIMGKWLKAKFGELVKPKKGVKLTVDQIAERLNKVFKDEKAQKIAKQLAAVQFGGEEEFEKHLTRHALSLVGAYLQFLSHGFTFDAVVVMPGQIVESNGVIGKNKASWSFTHDQIFPRYRMHVRSVAFSKANDLGGGRAILRSAADAAVLARGIEALNPDQRKGALAALKECARARSAKPLLDFANGPQGVRALTPLLKKIGLTH